jgi:hypothetical protein
LLREGAGGACGRLVFAPSQRHESSERAEGWAAQEDNFIAHKTYKIPAPYLPRCEHYFLPRRAPLSALTQRQIEKHFVLLFLLLLGGAKKFNQVALAHTPRRHAPISTKYQEKLLWKKFRFGNCEAENFCVPLTTINTIYGQRVSHYLQK